MNIGHGVYNNNAMLGVFYNLLFCIGLHKQIAGIYICVSLYIMIVVISGGFLMENKFSEQRGSKKQN